MLTFVRARLAEFRRDRSGFAAAEMAILAPIMILLALMGVDVTRYALATEQVEQVANTIGQMIVTTGPTTPGGTTATVSDTDLQFYHDSAMVIFPDVLSDAANQGIPWGNDIAISMTFIQFTQVAPSCTVAGPACYHAAPVWTAGNKWRSCNTKPIGALPSDASVPSPTALPPDVYGPGSLVAVDVQYTYHPWFGSYFGMALPIARSMYVAPRYVQTLTYQGAGIIAQTC
jgi:hypothetical protein